jgi:hypothetical protein
MDGNEAPSGPSSCAANGGPDQSTAALPTAAEEIWLCPSVVSLTAAEITAALYAFSDLMDEMTNHACKAVVRDELSFIVARYGTAMIEHIAEWLVECWRRQTASRMGTARRTDPTRAVSRRCLALDR